MKSFHASRPNKHVILYYFAQTISELFNFETPGLQMLNHIFGQHAFIDCKNILSCDSSIGDIVVDVFRYAFQYATSYTGHLKVLANFNKHVNLRDVIKSHELYNICS